MREFEIQVGKFGGNWMNRPDHEPNWKKLRQAEKQRLSGVESNDVQPPSERFAERRGSKRVLVHLPVMVRGHTAGVNSTPLTKKLVCELDRSGRVKVNPDLSLPGHPEIFAIGH